MSYLVAERETSIQKREKSMGSCGNPLCWFMFVSVKLRGNIIYLTLPAKSFSAIAVCKTRMFNRTCHRSPCIHLLRFGIDKVASRLLRYNAKPIDNRDKIMAVRKMTLYACIEGNTIRVPPTSAVD